MLLEQQIAQYWRPVASSKAPGLLYLVMFMVTYRCIAIVIKAASKVGVFFHHHLFACHPGSCRGNTEQVVTQSQCPGAYSVALDLLHCAMLCALLQSIRMAIIMACNGGTFTLPPPFCMTLLVAKDHVMVYKNKYQDVAMFITILSIYSYCLGCHQQQQWMPIWLPLSPADEPDHYKT